MLNLLKLSTSLALVTDYLSNYDRTTACLIFYVTGLKVSKVQEGSYFASRKFVCSFRR